MVSGFNRLPSKMRGGRKAQTFTIGDRIQQPHSVDASVSARNLRRKDLGAVIFGCTHSTMNECLQDQIFGLPSLHWSYVRNIQPRLPLFLFNYSDRKLHGIFEAASPGQLDINPYGWTGDGSEKTPYPAQVRICIRKQCQSLLEEQYRSILVDNYYEESNRYFWFELDHVQTGQLLSLFESLPVRTAFPYNAPIQRTVSEFSVKNVRKNEHQTSKSARPQAFSDNMWAALVKDKDAYASTEAEKVGRSAMMSAVDEKNKAKQIIETASDMECMQSEEERVYLKLQRIALERKSLNTFPKDHREEAAVLCATSETHLEDDYAPAEPSVPENWEDVSETRMKNDRIPVAPSLAENWEGVSEEHLEGDCSPASSSIPDNWEDVYDTLVEDGSSPVAPLIPENWEDVSLTHLEGKCSSAEASVPEKCEDVSETHLEDDCSPEAPSVPENSKDISKTHLDADCSHAASFVPETRQDVSVNPASQSTLDQLRADMKDMKALYMKQSRKTIALEKQLASSIREVQELKDQLKLLQSQLKGCSACNSESLHDNGKLESIDESRIGMNELIFLMGGSNGDGWLSTIECYSTSSDIVRSLATMNFSRSYSSAAVSNGCIFNFGGRGSDGSWYDTADCYSPFKNEWIPCPPLSERKGSLACATFQDNIYAFGGGNGVECSSKVEMFDPDLGRWIPIQSMLEKRFAAAATELNGALYVVGGYYDGKYLKSAERFDPREVSWSRLPSMTTSRGSHSLAVLNEKLYALGGFDGTTLVASVEIFEPRNGSWILGDAMKQPRGYCFAPVIGEKIYVIGGVTAHGTFADTVECYKQGSGWSVTNLKGIGKRSFFSAVLM